jgi:hypothetical protein
MRSSTDRVIVVLRSMSTFSGARAYMRSSQVSTLISASILLISAAPAHAYLDPNSGGLVFQIVTPLLALLAASFGFARRRLVEAWAFLSATVRNRLARLFRVSGREAE